MKRIWSVIHERTGKHWWFENYTDAIASVQLKFGEQKFPTEQQVTDATRIGFAPSTGDWIQINAVLVYDRTVNLI